MKFYRTEKNGAAIYKILEHRKLKFCPECHEKKSLSYVGFMETYMSGRHAKMFVCKSCNTWIDMIWDKELGRFTDKEPAEA